MAMMLTLLRITQSFNVHREPGSTKHILEWNTKQPSEKTYFCDDDTNSQNVLRTCQKFRKLSLHLTELI